MMYNVATRLLLAALLFTGSGHAYCQPTVMEELRVNINSAPSDSARLKALLLLCAQWQAINPDTVKKYNDEARSLAFLLADREALWLTDYYNAVYQFKKKGPDSAYNKAVAAEQWYNSNHPYDSMYVNLYRLKINILLKQMKVEEITAASFELLRKAVAANDPRGQIAANMGIGSASLKMEKAAEAMKWYNKALQLVATPSLRREFNVLYGNIAIAYYIQWAGGNTSIRDSITANTSRGVQYARESDNLTQLADALLLHGSMLSEAGKISDAEMAMNEALAIRKQIGDTYYALTDMLGMVMFYQNNNEHEKAINVALEGLRLAAGYGFPWSTVYALYEKLGQSYEAVGDYKKYAGTLSQLILMNDSAYRSNSLSAMAEMETKYGLKTKENTIIRQQLAIANREKLAAASLCLLLLLAAVGYWAFTRYSQRQKKQLQAEKDSGKAGAAIAVKLAEESQRKRIAAELHDNIGAQISYITSNIDWIVDSPYPLGHEEQAERLKNVHQTSVDVMRNLRETLWALNREEIALDEFADKLKSYIQTILRIKPGIQFSSSEQLLGETILSPLVALNMFRIMQEAANNVLKHSGASKLHLSVTETGGSQFELKLEDNGAGFDKDAFFDGHYGLKNMRFRANEVGIDMKIESMLGEGSKITVSKQYE